MNYVKIMLAIDNDSAEKAFDKKKNEYVAAHASELANTKFLITKVVTTKETLKEALAEEQNLPSVLVYAETLKGSDSNEDGIDFILNIRRMYPTIRIVVLAGNRNVGDPQLAALVALGIYDILAGQIYIAEVFKCVAEPKTYADVTRYLPEFDSRIFEGGSKSVDMYKQSAEAAKQMAADREAERKVYTAKLDAMAKDIEQARRENGALNGTISDLRDQLEATKNKAAADLALEQQTAQEQLREADSTRKEMEGRITAVTIERDTLRTQLATAKTDYGQLDEARKASDNALAAAKAELAVRGNYYELVQTCKSYAAEKVDMQKTIGDLNAKVDESGSHIVDLESQIRTLQGEITQRDGTIRSNSEAAAQASLDLSNKLADRGRDIEALNARIDSLTNDRIESQKLVSELRQTIAAMETDAADKSHQYEEQHTALLAAQQKIQAQDVQLNNYRQALEERTAQLNSSERQDAIAQLDLQRQQLLTENELAKQETAALIASRSVDVEAAIQKKRDELDLMEKRMQMLNGQAAAKTDEIGDIQKQLEIQRAQYEQVIAKLESDRVNAALALDAANTQLAKAKSDTDATIAAIMAEHQEEIDRLKAEKTSLTKKQSTLRINVDDLTRQLDTARTDLEVVNRYLADAAKEKEKASLDLTAIQRQQESVLADARRRSEAALAQLKKEDDEKRAAMAQSFDAEKKRLIAEYTAAAKAIDDKKRESDMMNSFRFSPEDYISTGSKTALVSMFYSPTPGAGNTSIALNVASLMAKGGKKTLFLSFEWQKSRIKDMLGIGFLRGEIASGLEQLVNKDFSVLNGAIINKSNMMNASDGTQSYYAQYPDQLNFVFYGKNKANSLAPSPDMMKGIITYYAKMKNYERIVVDVPCYASPECVEAVRSIANRHLVVMAHDAVSMESVGEFFAVSRNRTDSKGARLALGKEPLIICNRYCVNTPLNTRQIADHCGVNGICAIADKTKEFLLAANKFSPTVLVTQDIEFVKSIQTVISYISGSPKSM